MAYTKTNWVDKVTPLSAANMNNIEGGIAAHDVDYIVTQGITGIWTWEKWNSGLAKCWGVYSSVSIATSAWSAWGNLYTAPVVVAGVIVFPFVFKEIPRVFKDLGNVAGSMFLVDGWNGTTSASAVGDIYAMRPTIPAGVCTGNLELYVVGKWK